MQILFRKQNSGDPATFRDLQAKKMSLPPLMLPPSRLVSRGCGTFSGWCEASRQCTAQLAAAKSQQGLVNLSK